MRRPSDYRDEMDRLDPRLVDAALAGRETGEPALDRAAQLVADLRRALLEEPGTQAPRHLAAMAAAAEHEVWGSSTVLSEHRAARPGRRRLAGVALAAVLLLGAGMAWGAVSLPDQASDRAEEAVAAAQERGNGAPEAGQTEGVETEDGTHGEQVGEVAHDDSLEGCEKGQAVSEVAGSNADEGGPKHDPCAKGDEGGQAGGAGQEASAKGKAKAEEAKAKDHGPPEDAGAPGKVKEKEKP